MDTEGLGIGRLHLNRKGNSQFARNFINYIEHWYFDLPYSNDLENTTYTGINSTSILQPPGTTDASKILDENDWVSSLKHLRNKNLQKTIVSHININSIRKTFQNFIALTDAYIDVLIISKTKLDESLPDAMFRRPCYKAAFAMISRPCLGIYWCLWKNTLSPNVSVAYRYVPMYK